MNIYFVGLFEIAGMNIQKKTKSPFPNSLISLDSFCKKKKKAHSREKKKY